MAARRRSGRGRAALLVRFSTVFTDIILLAQVLGALANLLWYLEISTADLVGFLYVGGDIAGLLAYFGFMLFGLLFFWLAPRRFWMSLHPLNLGLALLLLAQHRLWDGSALLLAPAAAAGALAGAALFRWALRYPRMALIAFAAGAPLVRYGMPREVAPYALALFGALFIMLVVARPLRRLRPRRAATAAPSATG